jgi:DnaJ-domain-containing protein 1
MEMPDEVTIVAYQMQLAGNHLNSDNQTVYRILKSLTLDTEAYEWVQPKHAASNGRQAALALMDHYNGQAEVLNRYNMAKQEMEEAE